MDSISLKLLKEKLINPNSKKSCHSSKAFFPKIEPISQHLYFVNTNSND